MHKYDEASLQQTDMYVSKIWLFVTSTLVFEMEEVSESNMTEVEELRETLVLNSTLTWLIVQEDFSELIVLFCILSSQRSLHQC
jgi:hypothetical protein